MITITVVLTAAVLAPAEPPLGPAEFRLREGANAR